MSFAGVLTDNVTIVHRDVTGEDDTGDPVETWTEDTETVNAWVEGRALGIRGSIGGGERLGGRDTITEDFLVIVPLGTDVDPYDRIVHDGRTFEVVGLPAVAPTPSGPHHLELNCRWVEGG